MSLVVVFMLPITSAAPCVSCTRAWLVNSMVRPFAVPACSMLLVSRLRVSLIVD